MKDINSKLAGGCDLTAEEAKKGLETIMSGNANDIEMAAFLTALRMKGETPGEIASFAGVMREFSVKIHPRVKGTLVDLCGTGGDKSNTFNISTAAMFVVSAAGIPVAKHGNRALTSHCGSADVLEELGCNLQISPERIEKSIEEVGIGFMFAPLHHPAMKRVMHVRKALGFRTVFNMLGPLTNPASAGAQVTGVYDPDLTEKIAEVYKLLGLERAMVVSSEEGMDEISTLGRTKVSMLNRGKIDTYYINPEDYGIKRAELSDLTGGSPETNAKIIREILSGNDTGPKRDIVIINAAAGILVGGVAKSMDDGIKTARELLDSGTALQKMEEYITYTNLST